MNKLEVQQRVLQNGIPLALDKFEWDEKVKAFSSVENNLVIDSQGIFGCTFTTGSYCTFKTGSYCTFTTGWYCTFTTGSDCTFTTGSDCTFTTGSGCTFTTGSDCTFTTGSYCTFTTGSDCTFTTGSDCTFTTGSDCTFTTGSYCTFKTGSDCTFKTGLLCVIIRRDVFEVIQPAEGDVIQLCPYNVSGHLVNGMKDGIPHIIADGILSRIVSQKAGVHKVINHGEESISYLIKSGDNYSHGKTVKEARESLIYKISSRDTSQYNGMTLDSVITKAEAIAMYRAITGACENGTRYFVENTPLPKKKNYTVSEIIDLTEGQYNHNLLTGFFSKQERASA